MMDALSFLRETDGASHILIFDDDPTTLDSVTECLGLPIPRRGYRLGLLRHRSGGANSCGPL